MKRSSSFINKALKFTLFATIAVLVIFWLGMLVTNGGTLFREDEAKAACYALVSQKYPNAQVLSWEARAYGFGELQVSSRIRAPHPDRLLTQVEISYDCVVTFRTGFPQARLVRLDVLS